MTSREPPDIFKTIKLRLDKILLPTNKELVAQRLTVQFFRLNR